MLLVSTLSLAIKAARKNINIGVPDPIVLIEVVFFRDGELTF
jgi:hypothetical protein